MVAGNGIMMVLDDFRLYNLTFVCAMETSKGIVGVLAPGIAIILMTIHAEVLCALRALSQRRVACCDIQIGRAHV